MSDAKFARWASAGRANAESSGYLVRPAEVTDAAGLAAVHVRVWRETYAELMSAEYLAAMNPETFARHWSGVLRAQDNLTRIHVALDSQERLVGFASAGPSRDEDGPAPQELYAINVLLSAHGIGVAHLLMSAVVEPVPCSLWVAVGNDRAEAFYRRYGFVGDGETMTDERSGVVEQRMLRASVPA